jgi:hypothetical protein
MLEKLKGQSGMDISEVHAALSTQDTERGEKTLTTQKI